MGSGLVYDTHAGFDQAFALGKHLDPSADPWQVAPECPAQSDNGLAAMLSALHVLALTHLHQLTPAQLCERLGFIGACLGDNAPAVLALHALSSRRLPGRAATAFLSRALYALCRQIVPGLKRPDGEVFELARLVLSSLFARAAAYAAASSGSGDPNRFNDAL